MTEQAARLRRLREQLGLQAIDAAKLAGVSRWAWARMESGEKRIDTVSLARFLAFRPFLGADYVVNGKFTGLPPELVKELVLREATHSPSSGGGAAGNGPAPGHVRSGRSRRRSTIDT